jgi:predicted N-acyltransferase
LAYYPKLVCAMPYTPAEGPRIILADDESLETILPELQTQLLQCVKNERASSLHILFTDTTLNNTIEHNPQNAELLPRYGVQYHWFNRHAIDADLKPYAHFPDFLSEFNSRKRRSLNKERKAVAAQKVTLKRLTGTAISESYWDAFYHCYQLTYLKRSGHGGYLNREFFRLLANTMAEQVLMVVAERDGIFVAAALCFIGSDTLYGRYWGCMEDVDGLHFEACYYQGIEFCIEKKLHRFDPGAQGEHKIARGFRPVFTRSWHYLADPRFQEAIKDFLAREQPHIRDYQREAEQLLPFRQEDGTDGS